MQAYEFYATPENGTITIPEHYRNRIKSGVKVILLEQKPSLNAKPEENTNCKSNLLLPPTMKTNGWRFSREKANER